MPNVNNLKRRLVRPTQDTAIQLITHLQYSYNGVKRWSVAGRKVGQKVEGGRTQYNIGFKVWVEENLHA